jgi:hypothetical protein
MRQLILLLMVDNIGVLGTLYPLILVGVVEGLLGRVEGLLVQQLLVLRGPTTPGPAGPTTPGP